MVTFETKCWENDWKLMLKTNYLKDMISNCNYPFKDRVLYINNVNDVELVTFYAQKSLTSNIIDRFIIVEDFADEVLKHFHIEKTTFGKGYYYSIAELTAIYLCTTPYLLHFSSDARIERLCKTNWIANAIDIMEQNNRIAVTNTGWNYDFDAPANDSVEENDSWYIGYGFSDQCYLVKKDLFNSDIYNYQHPHSERYPQYGGNSFEKRIDSFLVTEEKYRMTSKLESYVHKNITSSTYFRYRFKKMVEESILRR